MNSAISKLASTFELGFGANSQVRCPPGQACGWPRTVTSRVAVPNAQPVATWSMRGGVSTVANVESQPLRLAQKRSVPSADVENRRP